MPLAHLLSSGKIGTLTLRNRIVMAAMGSDLSGAGGIAGERIRDYYEARARGGCGMIVTEAVPVLYPSGFSRPHAIAIQNDVQRRGAEQLVRAIQRHGAAVAMQLNHHGPQARRDILEGRPLLVPSLPHASGSDMDGIWLPEEREARKALQKDAPPIRFQVLCSDDIAALVEAFAAAAAGVRDVGADAIEIHAGHGFLLSSFLSSRTNRRNDQYGGSAENRARFLTEVLRAVRRRVGPDFPVWCKIDAVEHLVGNGITPADASITARLLHDAGASAIGLSASADPARAIALTESNIPHRPEGMIDAVRMVERISDLPIIASGRLAPERASRLIAQGTIDFATFGRKLLADPDMAAKLASGRTAEIRPCMYCYACISQLSFDRPIKCAANPDTAHETSRAVRPAARTLNVAVAGGGPAGMEAARRLALAGHRVTLLEAAPRLGGTMRYAALAYPPNEDLLNWLIREVRQSGADIRLGTRVDAQSLIELQPDLCVVAIGAQRPRVQLPGADRPHALSGDDFRAMMEGERGGAAGYLLRVAGRLGLTARIDLMRQLSRLWMPLSRDVVIVGSGLVGLEMADFLAHRRRRVRVIDTAPVAGAGLQVIRRARVLHELQTMQVPIVTGCSEIEIGSRHVRFVDGSGAMRSVKAGSVILATGTQTNPSLAAALRAHGLRTEEIGDCHRMSYIEGSLEDAAILAASLDRD